MTDVQICNVGLAMLGLKRISSLTSDQREAVACNLHYQSSVNEILAEHEWGFAKKRATLAQSADTNLTGYDYLYTLPSDMVRLIALDEDGELVTEYAVEGGKVAADSETLRALYVAEVSDPNRFPPQVARTISMLLAYNLAIEFQQSRSLSSDMYTQYRMNLERARQIEQQQETAGAGPSMWEDIF